MALEIDYVKKQRTQPQKSVSPAASIQQRRWVSHAVGLALALLAVWLLADAIRIRWLPGIIIGAVWLVTIIINSLFITHLLRRQRS